MGDGWSPQALAPALSRCSAACAPFSLRATWGRRSLAHDGRPFPGQVERQRNLIRDPAHTAPRRRHGSIQMDAARRLLLGPGLHSADAACARENGRAGRFGARLWSQPNTLKGLGRILSARRGHARFRDVPSLTPALSRSREGAGRALSWDGSHPFAPVHGAKRARRGMDKAAHIIAALRGSTRRSRHPAGQDRSGLESLRDAYAVSQPRSFGSLTPSRRSRPARRAAPDGPA
jgi:hypothetical protein